MAKQSAYYQELKEILQPSVRGTGQRAGDRRTGCPVCHVGHKVARSYLENLLWGSVNDRETRERLDQVLGFCGPHSRALLAYQGERLGTTIIEQAMLKEALRRLQQVSVPEKRPGVSRQLAGLFRAQSTAPPSPRALPAKGSCPVCDHQVEMERRSLESLVQHLVGDLDTLLQQAGGLCWDHLDRALALAPAPEVVKVLLAIHSQAWQETIDHMGEFIRKRDYRFSQEPLSDQEAVSMLRAIAILTGEYPPPE
jgi:hypothetical protein